LKIEFTNSTKDSKKCLFFRKLASKKLRKKNTHFPYFHKRLVLKSAPVILVGRMLSLARQALFSNPLRPMRFILFEWRAQQALRPPFIQIAENSIFKTFEKCDKKETRSRGVISVVACLQNGQQAFN